MYAPRERERERETHIYHHHHHHHHACDKHQFIRGLPLGDRGKYQRVAKVESQCQGY